MVRQKSALANFACRYAQKAPAPRIYCCTPVYIHTDMAEEPFNPNEATEHTAEEQTGTGFQSQAKQAASDIKNAASAKVDAVRAAASAKAGDFKKAASAKADDLRSAASAKAEEFRSAANAKAEEFRGRAEDAWGEAKVTARSYQEDGEAYVRENPTRAVLIGIAAGFMLGLIVRK
jgi:ElaB/YqjD/DUF883 family membrane-anchored ribosome-binding protein